MEVPDIDGVDLGANNMRLSDFRGRVVLLSFWASWCRPCRELIPQEKEILNRFEGLPFSIVGVNGDKDLASAQALVEKHGMSWRSFQNDRPGNVSISTEWKLAGWPTLYLIDHKGLVVRKWVGAPDESELETNIRKLINET